jgi:hypothetical protein
MTRITPNDPEWQWLESAFGNSIRHTPPYMLCSGLQERYAEDSVLGIRGNCTCGSRMCVFVQSDRVGGMGAQGLPAERQVCSVMAGHESCYEVLVSYISARDGDICAADCDPRRLGHLSIVAAAMIVAKSPLHSEPVNERYRLVT